MSERTILDQIDELYRCESRRVFASLVRLLNDFDLADDAMHEAYAAAIEMWPRDGVPTNPRAWLVSTGRFKAQLQSGAEPCKPIVDLTSIRAPLGS